MTRTLPNPSAALAVLLQLHDRDFSSSFAKEHLSNSFPFDSLVRKKASERESKKKKKKTHVLASAPLHTQDTEIGLGALV